MICHQKAVYVFVQNRNGGVASLGDTAVPLLAPTGDFQGTETIASRDILHVPTKLLLRPDK